MLCDGNLRWRHFQDNLYIDKASGLMLDLSRMRLPADFWPKLAPRLQQALAEMRLQEAGVADEQGIMAGHFWLRAPELAPEPQIALAISTAWQEIAALAEKVHGGYLRGEDGEFFSRLLLIGVGGSCQGTRFISRALSGTAHKMRLFFLDNTDPDGMEEVLAALKPLLKQTLVAVVSKSGATLETLNSMRATAAFFQADNLNFARHAISVSAVGSALDEQASAEGWLARFHVPDWLSGRFSLCSAVGLLPLALQGVDIDALLASAARMDVLTGQSCLWENPAALLAGACFSLTGEGNNSQLVLLPYKDCLDYLPHYLQQLLMESIGKEYERNGRRVCQGLTLYGNKGSSDQHSFLQQLLAGPDNFCALFVEVLSRAHATSLMMGDPSAIADALEASLLATRQLLSTAGRRSMTITLPAVDAARLGAFLALWERAVGLAAALLNLNAYDQPAVEQIKLALPPMLALKTSIVAFLADGGGQAFTLEQIMAALDADSDYENIFKWLRYLTADPDSHVRLRSGVNICQDSYYYQHE